MSIEQIVAGCVVQIESIHTARERTIAATRVLVRQSANSIRAAHRGDFVTARHLLALAAEVVAEINDATAGAPEVRYAGYTQDALKEYAEAHLVFAFLAGEEPPTGEMIGVEPAAYLNGLAEAASELRRAILDGLRRGEIERSERLLTIMDDVYSSLLTVDYPEAITGGLRRSTDALRTVLERTRGDVTAAIRQEQLIAAMKALEARLE
ncbi:translin family protein [Chloroflexus aggregans]|uniref:Translin n=1 Tax=Chloroflexus aggregans (strain MD-66 / DSM 9485) TaxID=326427 RepID=B8G8L0_CHLAD|nr:haloacid dehalogenase [Chloroflexus aggregans]ACL24272.1 Translin [Chloroflexus aggregans DSM 9485]